MRIPNKHLSKLIVWIISGDILASSCVSPYEFMLDEENQTIDDLNKFGGIKIDLTQDEKEYLRYLNKLAYEIIVNKNTAYEFSKDPNRFYSAGRVGAIPPVLEDVEPTIHRIAMALSDDEVLNAIESKDVKRYILTLYDKGYLEKYDVESNLYSEEDKITILKSLGYSDVDIASKQYIVPGVAVVLFLCVAVCVSCATIMYTAVGAVNIGVGMTIVATIAAVFDFKVSGIGYYDLFEDESWDIWILKEDADIDIKTSSELEEMIGDVLEAYSIIYEKEMQNVDVEKLKNTIILNTEKANEQIVKKLNANIDGEGF